MCGICGKIYLDSHKRTFEHEIVKMRDTLENRGPDDAGLYIKGNVGLGHSRLSIIDIDTSHQPMCNEDGTVWIVYNGEIYNFQELRKDLLIRGHKFQTNGDTEVIIHLYEEYGNDCVNKLRGMFAFAIWDKNDKSLFLARDRVGIKPLYYFFNKDVFLFGSEIKSILADENFKSEKSMDTNSLLYYFSFLYVPEPKTIFKGIEKLLPGHTLLLKNNKIEINKYWDVCFQEIEGNVIQNEEYYCERLLEILTDAIKVRLISDVPLGAFLSGGIDSSSVVALMSQISSKPVKTFSIGFSVDKYNEANDAKIVADYFNTEHTELIINPADIIKSIPDIISHFDEPFADSSAIPTFYVSKMTRDQVTVALSGDGGDELFGGYSWWQKRPNYQLNLDKFPQVAKKAIKMFAGLVPLKFAGANYLKHIDIPYTRYLLNTKAVFNEYEKNCLYSRDLLEQFRDCDLFKWNIGFLERKPDRDWMSRIMEYDFKTYLPNDILQKVDRMSMFHSLEARVPILDHKLVEFAATIPASLKIKDGISKYIFKRSMRGILPEEILHKRKQGFSIPLETWLRSDLKDLITSVILDSNHHDLFSRDYVEKIMKEFFEGNDRHDFKIWELFTFELWYQKHFN